MLPTSWPSELVHRQAGSHGRRRSTPALYDVLNSVLFFLPYVERPTDCQLADILTKGLGREAHEQCVRAILAGGEIPRIQVAREE